MTPDHPSDELRLDDVLDTVRKMAEITADFARSEDLPVGARIMAAGATARIAKDAAPVVKMRHEEARAEQVRATESLTGSYTEGAPFRLIRRETAKQLLVKEAKALGIDVKETNDG